MSVLRTGIVATLNFTIYNSVQIDKVEIEYQVVHLMLYTNE